MKINLRPKAVEWTIADHCAPSRRTRSPRAHRGCGLQRKSGAQARATTDGPKRSRAISQELSALHTFQVAVVNAMPSALVEWEDERIALYDLERSVV